MTLLMWVTVRIFSFLKEILGIQMSLFLLQLVSSDEILGLTVSMFSKYCILNWELPITGFRTLGLFLLLSDLLEGEVNNMDPVNKHEAVVLVFESEL